MKPRQVPISEALHNLTLLEKSARDAREAYVTAADINMNSSGIVAGRFSNGTLQAAPDMSAVAGKLMERANGELGNVLHVAMRFFESDRPEITP